MNNENYINDLIGKAKVAQAILESYDQEKIDSIVKVIAKVIFDNAAPLARMAVDETRMGVYDHKVLKNQGKARILWNDLKDKKSVGILRELKDEGIIEIAKPMGVVGAITPCTNPIVTPMCNAMFALKARNSIIIAPHPRAKKCACELQKLYQAEFEKMGVPKDIFQVIEEPSIQLSGLLMKNVDVVIATGGMGMVKAAYSSGKPAFGVGAGNVQCILDKDIDYSVAVPKIITGRSFDNGIICSGEQTMIAPEENYDEIINEFKKNGAYYIDNPIDAQKLREVIFPDNIINKNLVGQPISIVAKTAGLDIPADTKVILVKADGEGTKDLFCREKMCSIIAAFKYSTIEEAVNIAQANLNVEGKGHSASIHSNNDENIKYVGENLTVSRLVVNQVASTTLGGSYFNGFNPTTTLGCGSWGNNSISENLSFKHLINISRIGYYMEDRTAPTDDELWS